MGSDDRWQTTGRAVWREALQGAVCKSRNLPCPLVEIFSRLCRTLIYKLPP
jgi:hypothetical protein